MPCFATPAPAAAATSAAAVEMLNVLRAVAAGPGGVDEVVALRPHGEHVLAHRLGAAGDLVGGLALQPQRDQEAADLRRRRLAAHDLAHHLARLARARGRGRRAAAGAPAWIMRALQEVPRELAPDAASAPTRDGTGRRRPAARGGARPSPRRRRACAETSSTSGTRGRRERVVAARPRTSSGSPAKSPRPSCVTGPDLPWTSSLRQADLAAEGLDDRLVAEADAERRHARRESADDLERRARVGRPAGAGGDRRGARARAAPPRRRRSRRSGARTPRRRARRTGARGCT